MTLFVENLSESQSHRVKYSSFILEKRKYLSNLIKTRNYKEAELVKNQLREMEQDEDAKWLQKIEEKKLLKIEKM
jgi:protein-arginine kinase activator protein McsA